MAEKRCGRRAVVALAGILGWLLATSPPVLADSSSAGSLVFVARERAAGVAGAVGPAATALSSVGLQLDESGAVVRSTPVDPGIVGAAGAVIGAAGGPPGLLPAYPLYADATAPPGQTVQVGGTLPAGPMAGHAFSGTSTAGPDSASGVASVGDASTPGGSAQANGSTMTVVPGSPHQFDGLARSLALLLRGSGLHPTSTEAANDAVVSVRTSQAQGAARHSGVGISGEATSTLQGVSLLGGTVTIDAVVAHATFELPDPSSTPKTVSESHVLGVRVMGVPVEITPNGLAVAGQKAGVPIDSVTAALNQAVAATGLNIVPGKRSETTTSVLVEALRLEASGNSVALGSVFMTYGSHLPGAEASGVLPGGGDSAMATSGSLSPAAMPDGSQQSASSIGSGQQQLLPSVTKGELIGVPRTQALRPAGISQLGFNVLGLVSLLAALAWLGLLIAPGLQRRLVLR